MVLIECPSCGRPVALTGEGLTLWRRPDGCDLLRYTCPLCGFEVEGCAPPESIPTLARLKVPVVAVPAEALEAHSGPPLTLDDLIDLHFLIESEDVWAAIEASWENRPS